MGLDSTRIEQSRRRKAQDLALVKRAVEKKDQAAYQELMKRYKPSITRLMLNMVHNQSDAEDLTIEAFAKAFKKIHTYTNDYAFSTWLFKIATNNCIDHIRRKRIHTLSIDTPRADSDSGETYSSMVQSTELTPEEDVMRTQKLKLIRRGMRKLSPQYRLLLEMRYFEDSTYDTIAADMDIPLGTVKAQLYRAKQMLQRALKEEDIGSHIEIKGKLK